MGKIDKKDFEINLYQLENKQYTFDFEIKPEFFSQYPDTIIENGKGKAFLILTKSETMIQLDFKVELELELVCDLSLKEFWYPVKTDREVIIKFGPEEKELSEDVRVIKPDTQKLNVGDYIYEFATLCVPMKKVHPDMDSVERPDLVYSSQSEQEEEKKEIDPRWEALKKLKK